MELSLKSLLCSLLIIVVSVSTVDSLQCHDCNSGSNYEGSACSDKFDPLKYVTTCAQNYTRCRKTVQTVGDDVRTVRSCATAGTQTGCIDRTGTSGVRAKYCQCDTNNCNGSSGVMASIFLVFLLALGGNAFANAS